MVRKPRIAIAASGFNRPLVERLVEGAIACLSEHAIDQPKVYWVSGAFELPHLAARLIQANSCDGLVALGAVIRGETPHFDYVCQGVTSGLMQLITSHAFPIGFGLLTVDNLHQAEQRAALEQLRAATDHAALQGQSNKGYEAAEAVINSLAVCGHL